MSGFQILNIVRNGLYYNFIFQGNATYKVFLLTFQVPTSASSVISDEDTAAVTASTAATSGQEGEKFYVELVLKMLSRYNKPLLFIQRLLRSRVNKNDRSNPPKN